MKKTLLFHKEPCGDYRKNAKSKLLVKCVDLPERSALLQTATLFLARLDGASLAQEVIPNRFSGMLR